MKSLLHNLMQPCRCLLMLSMLFLLPTTSHSNAATSMRHSLGNWVIQYDNGSQTFSITHAKRTVFTHLRPEATYSLADGKVRTVTVADAFACTAERKRQSVTYSFSCGDVTIDETFRLYGHQLLVAMTLQSPQTIESNYLAPLCLNTPQKLFPAHESNRVLKVPFDNDDFVRYHHYAFGETVMSFETGAFYCGQTGEGIVVGSIDHDHWKSAVESSTDSDGTLLQMRAFSGVSHRETRDVLPHATLRGRTISSARFFLSHTTDWRDGLEQFAECCVAEHPRRENWGGGAPFGWQSWGVMSDKNSFQVDVAVSRYMHDVLMPAGFCNSQGRTVMSIDSWDNLSDEQKTELCTICIVNNQVPGTYWTPFCLWWDEARLFRDKLPGQDRYLAADCVLRANGQLLKYDGAYCLDPTHPGVKAWIDAEVGKIKRHGFQYLKVDFTDNAIIQADSYYNPAVRTAVEAYNEGFSYFCMRADEGKPLYIALSIAPLFPYQYGNSRRMACDTWGRIWHTEYSMNALSGGWWTNLLYQYNDPDHCPLIGNDDGLKTTLGENRARYTNLMVSGMALVCDNFDLDDRSGRGNAPLSRERSLQIMTNAEVNAVGRLGRSFRPIYGYKEHGGSHEGAESFFTLTADGCTYLAVFNYGEQPMEGRLPLKVLGCGRSRRAKELWTGIEMPLTGAAISYNVPPGDARLYRIER